MSEHKTIPTDSPLRAKKRSAYQDVRRLERMLDLNKRWLREKRRREKLSTITLGKAMAVLLLLASTAFAADKMRVSTADVEVCTVDKAGVYARGPAFVGQACADYKKTIARAAADNDDRFVWFCWLLDPCSSP